YNCVLRADINFIRVGARSNIQDGSVVHVETDYGDGGHPAIIGDDVLIGHMALVHGCILHDRAFVGMGAIVMNRAEIGEYALVAAGALVPEGKKIPPRMLAVGSPAKLVRELTNEEVEGLKRTALGYQERAKRYLEEGIVGRQD
ncbi:MAG: gamma carbonic anhydrase family protein, partial [Cohnella sp.]|nr:gamma carbonic anhydrase family protein [Cohnella sp.]